MIKVATIAGSDASGGAGIEADLKTFAEYGLYGMAAVTLVATMDPDNSWAHTIFPLEEEALRSQLSTIFKGVGVAGAKSGMLGSVYAVDLVREFISGYNIKHYVLDPVMVCKGAEGALHPELNNAVAQKLLPLAEVVTPNLFEAGVLSGLTEIHTLDEAKEAARIIHGKGARHVLITGGATLLEAAETTAAGRRKAIDILYDGKDFILLEEQLAEHTYSHGAGCTLSAAITASLSRGYTVKEAARLAKRFVSQSIKAGFPLNKWIGPGNTSAWRRDRLFGGA